MSTGKNDFILTEYAKNLIKFKGRQLNRRGDFRSMERHDIEQRLWTMVVKRARQFTPGRASIDTFIDMVLRTGVAMLVREQQRKKSKNGRRTQSLDQIIPGASDQPEPLSASISEEDLARRVGRTGVDEAARREDQDAIADALRRMPPEARNVCRRVMGGSLTSAARDLRMSRRQAQRLLEIARPYLERAGFIFE